MILYINTSDQKTIEVVLKKGGEVVDKITEENEFGSQVLLPSIIEILKKNKLTFNDLEGVEVSEGPGSYTGLRVGASVGQALAYALGIPVNGKVGKPVKLRYT